MASSVPSKRTAAPTSLTPHAKPVITVEEWETKAPLDDTETRSVNRLKALTEKAALPPKVRPASQHLLHTIHQRAQVQRR